MQEFEYSQLHIKGKESEQVQPKKSSNFGTVIKLLKCAIGAGLLAMPYSFAQAGILGGFLVLLTICTLNFFGWNMSIKALIASDYPGSFIQALQSLYGPKSTLFAATQLATFMLLFGGNVGCIIFFISVIHQIIGQTVYGDIIIALVLFVVMMYCSTKDDLQSLSVITKLSVFLVVIFYVFFLYLSVADIFIYNRPIGPTQLFNWSEMPVAFGIFLFSFDINGVLTEIRQEMQKPQHFKVILLSSMLFETAIYTLFGVVGYITFGPSTNQLITQNFQDIISLYSEPVKIMFHVFNLIYSSTLIVNLLLYNIPCIRIIDTYMEIYFNMPTTQRNKYINRFIQVSGQILISFCFPDFASILSIAGCVCSVTLGFIIPYIVNARVFKGTLSMTRKIVNATVFILGICGGILGLIVNLVSI